MKKKEKVNLTLEDIYSMVKSATKRLLKEGALRSRMPQDEYEDSMEALGFSARTLGGKNGFVWELPNPEWPEKSTIQVQYEPHHDDRRGWVEVGFLDNAKKALLDSLNKKGAFMYNWFLKRDGTPNVDNCQTYIKMNNQFHWEQEPINFGDNVDYASIEKDLKSKEQANAEYANCNVWPVFPELNDECLVWFLQYSEKQYNLCRGMEDRRPLIIDADGQPMWFNDFGPAKDKKTGKVYPHCIKRDNDETIETEAYPIQNNVEKPIDFSVFIPENKKKYGKSVL